MTTPVFPAWRAQFGPLKSRVQQVRQQSLLHLDLLFGSLLPPWLLSQSEQGPNSREQIYSVRRTFFGFLYQVLNPDCPCREVVRQIQSLFALVSGRRVSKATGAYCIARDRLPLDTLARLRCAAAAHAQKASQLWKGFCVKVIDGTGISLPDTAKNQRAYPQSKEQKPGCGFPFLKVVGVKNIGVKKHWGQVLSFGQLVLEDCHLRPQRCVGNQPLTETGDGFADHGVVQPSGQLAQFGQGQAPHTTPEP